MTHVSLPAAQRVPAAWRAALARINWPLVLLVLAGVALRLWFIGVSPLDPRFSTADDGDYFRRALRFAATGQYIDDSWLIRPPLHVFFFAFWLRIALLFGSPTLGVRLIEFAQVGVGALSIVLAFACAQRLFSSRRAGLCFAAFLALWYCRAAQRPVQRAALPDAVCAAFLALAALRHDQPPA
jgi:hypothetical protein